MCPARKAMTAVMDHPVCQEYPARKAIGAANARIVRLVQRERRAPPAIPDCLDRKVIVACPECLVCLVTLVMMVCPDRLDSRDHPVCRDAMDCPGCLDRKESQPNYVFGPVRPVILAKRVMPASRACLERKDHRAKMDCPVCPDHRDRKDKKVNLASMDCLESRAKTDCLDCPV